GHAVLLVERLGLDGAVGVPPAGRWRGRRGSGRRRWRRGSGRRRGRRRVAATGAEDLELPQRVPVRGGALGAEHPHEPGVGGGGGGAGGGGAPAPALQTAT